MHRDPECCRAPLESHRIASVSPAVLALMTISRVPTTTTSAIAGLAIETFVIATGVVNGKARPTGRSTRVMDPIGSLPRSGSHLRLSEALRARSDSHGAANNRS